ncbi:DNA protecting protein DprA [Enterococcus sp. JM4C]|uniref:DNA-processing protein DprA n=1 Tax=Candidatus Enterococcus huntleyi TaxID=1857217 RepID=UPI00137A8253|nr:DNA-processing protein DprA [Enterococcus sp. JM4C]KAF1298051.1 DNA protecting protein DprA [Enterococcus sp. JM4C]
MDELEKLLFKLLFCRGISLKGSWRLIKYALEKQYTRFSMTEIINLAVERQHQQAFRESWFALSDEQLEEKWHAQPNLFCLSEEYPEILLEIPYPPIFLFYEGNLSLLKKNKLAFVGAREATGYGKRVVHRLIPPLVNEKFVIVSGLAKGIDAQSHQTVLSLTGQAIGVIGTGLDCCYPDSSKELQIELAKNHLLVSEYPKGVGPKRHHFPMRNRIIAGLSLGTCIIEAKKRSGSLITAQMAMEYGREVFAVPGDILSGHSNGCHNLIQDGAKCVFTADDILDELRHYL